MVYVEKFDNKAKVKIFEGDHDTIRQGILNAFLLESEDVIQKLKDDCEKRAFSWERGEIIFFTKSTFSQNFVIQVVNERLNLPGIKARGPKTFRPNLNLELPSVMNKMDGSGRGHKVGYQPAHRF